MQKLWRKNDLQTKYPQKLVLTAILLSFNQLPIFIVNAMKFILSWKALLYLLRSCAKQIIISDVRTPLHVIIGNDPRGTIVPAIIGGAAIIGAVVNTGWYIASNINSFGTMKAGNQTISKQEIIMCCLFVLVACQPNIKVVHFRQSISWLSYKHTKGSISCSLC